MRNFTRFHHWPYAIVQTWLKSHLVKTLFSLKKKRSRTRNVGVAFCAWTIVAKESVKFPNKKAPIFLSKSVSSKIGLMENFVLEKYKSIIYIAY